MDNLLVINYDNYDIKNVLNSNETKNNSASILVANCKINLNKVGRVFIHYRKSAANSTESKHGPIYWSNERILSI